MADNSLLGLLRMLLLSPGYNRLAIVAVLVIGLLASFSSNAPAQATTLVVTNLNDEGEGSLRQAIASAEESPGYDSIVFSPQLKGTLALASALPGIKSPVRITGPSAPSESITIQNNNGQSLSGDVTLSNLTFAKGATAEGGVFSNTGKLLISNCRFLGNQATDFNGGAIYNGGTVVIMDSIFSGNRAPSSFMNMGGGALFNFGGMTIKNCFFSGNRALKGGAVYNLGNGRLRISGSTFTGNEATQGGVIYNDMGDVSIEASTFANNRALEGGGAIFHSNATLDIRNCTFTGNRAAQKGGAIFNQVSSVLVDSCTFARNEAGLQGGALYNADRLELSNSIVAGNSAPKGPNIWGVVNEGDYNLVDKPSGVKLSGQHNITGKAPRLGTLASNGGPSQTLALLAGSPAIGKGWTDLSTDQRGWRRPANTPTSIGAFAAQKPPSTPALRASRSLKTSVFK